MDQEQVKTQIVQSFARILRLYESSIPPVQKEIVGEIYTQHLAVEKENEPLPKRRRKHIIFM